MSGTVIVAGARTPIGRLSGGLKDLTAAELGGHAIKGALERAGVTGDQVDYVIMGQVIQAGAGQNPARLAGVKAGIPMSVPSITINKVCLSGLNAVALSRTFRLGLPFFLFVGLVIPFGSAIASRAETTPSTEPTTTEPTPEPSTTEPTKTEVTVPALRGQTLSDARAALDRTGLRYRVLYRDSDATPNTVIDSDPAEGQEVPPDTRVTLVVAKAATGTPTATATTTAPAEGAGN